MINKTLFLNTLFCPTYGWMVKNNHIPTDKSLSAQMRIEEGLEIHHRAQNLYPDRLVINNTHIFTAAQKTIQVIIDKNIPVIYEATFIVDNYVTKADILVREKEGWHLFEIKSSVNLKEELIDDVAYTAMIINKSGLKVVKYSLFLLSKNYRLGMSDKDLFVEKDITKEVSLKMQLFSSYCQEVNKTLFSKTTPTPTLSIDCKTCEIFDTCVGKGIVNHIFDLPRLHKNKFYRLVDLGIFSIEDIPDDFELTDNQTVVWQSIKNEKPVVQPGLKKELEKVVFPAYYLDFETIQTAIPLYPNIAPFTQIPTQYSLHQCSAPGQIINHYEYLAEPSRDCRRELAERLIADCGKKGTIFEYSNFEQNIISGLIDEYPDLQIPLQAILHRIIDLCSIVRKYYYHPDFHGSYSIKDVLPVMVNDMGYDDLNISEGGEAMAVFAYMAKGKYNKQEMQTKRNELLEYCKVDTLAMVRVHEKLVEL